MTKELAEWLSNTAASHVITVVTWIIPTVQTIHILAVSAVVSAVALIYLRNFGLALPHVSRAELARRFFPVIWYGVLVLLVTGSILIVGEPKRELLNSMFRLKMILLLVALALTVIFQRPQRGQPHYWEQTAAHRAGAILLSVVSLAIWIGIVVAGRWIAYAAG